MYIFFDTKRYISDFYHIPDFLLLSIQSAAFKYANVMKSFGY